MFAKSLSLPRGCPAAIAQGSETQSQSEKVAVTRLSRAQTIWFALAAASQRHYHTATIFQETSLFMSVSGVLRVLLNIERQHPKHAHAQEEQKCLISITSQEPLAAEKLDVTCLFVKYPYSRCKVKHNWCAHLQTYWLGKKWTMVCWNDSLYTSKFHPPWIVWKSHTCDFAH